MAEKDIIDFIIIFSLLLGDRVEYFSIFLLTIIGKDTYPVFQQLAFWWNSRQSCNQCPASGLAELSSWTTAKLR